MWRAIALVGKRFSDTFMLVFFVLVINYNVGQTQLDNICRKLSLSNSLYILEFANFSISLFVFILENWKRCTLRF